MESRITNDELGDRLRTVSHELCEQYNHASPFKHVVIDELFAGDELRAVRDDCPSITDSRWTVFNNGYQYLVRSRGDSWLGPQIRQFLGFMRSSVFLSFLEQLTGIAALIPDPHAGGMYCLPNRGYLQIHTDANVSLRLKLECRLNVLVYLNENWDDTFGGALELWNARIEGCHKRILPLFNRTVVLEINEYNYHGIPERVRCGADESRKSLSVTYCTPWRGRWFGKHPTLYYQREGEPTRMTRDFVVRMLTPPILLRMAKRFDASLPFRKK